MHLFTEHCQLVIFLHFNNVWCILCFIKCTFLIILDCLFDALREAGSVRRQKRKSSHRRVAYLRQQEVINPIKWQLVSFARLFFWCIFNKQNI